MRRTRRTKVVKGASRPTTRNKQKELEKESRELELVEDMDTNDLIEESSQILSTKRASVFDQKELKTDGILDTTSTSRRNKKDKEIEKAIQKDITNNNNSMNDINNDIDSNNNKVGENNKDINNNIDSNDNNNYNSITDKHIVTSSTVITTKKSEKKGYDKKRTAELSKKYPDKYWRYHANTQYYMVNAINFNNQLVPLPCSIVDHGSISSMTLSPDGILLVTYSTLGSIQIYDLENKDLTKMKFPRLRRIRDRDELHIEEYYCGCFIPDNTELLVVGGKLKNRHRWSENDDDNAIMPCPLKIFDIVKGVVVSTLFGHKKEIYSIKAIKFNNENYIISTSEDGKIIKWKLNEDWQLVESHVMEDNLSTSTYTVSFLPSTGNKYFMATCDEHFRLYDFENNKLLQSFENIYSSICDCGKFINWLDECHYWDNNKKKKPDQQYAWFISRGTELCDEIDGTSTKQNTCALHRLIYPEVDGGEFILEEIKRYTHDEYESNSWFVKVTSNGRYILAPTINGQVFAFNLLTGQTTAILKAHSKGEVRDVIFHPFYPLIITCADDGTCKIFIYKNLAITK
ncbi:unnamed protein product [Cunninghamella blakesleeana]